MSSMNRAMILGRLGQDPELRYTPTGATVCTLSVATTDFWTDREGNRKESTEWHRIVIWGKQAENCSKYLTKGQMVFVEGRIQTRSWDDKNTGQKRYSTEIIATNVQFLGGGRDQGQPNSPQYGQGQGGGHHSSGDFPGAGGGGQSGFPGSGRGQSGFSGSGGQPSGFANNPGGPAPSSDEGLDDIPF